MARVQVWYEKGMGVSVYVKGREMQKGDYVSHYAVKGIFTAEEYTRIYDNKR